MNDFLQSIRNGSYAKDNGNNGKPRYNSGNNGQRPRRTYEPNGNNYMRNGNERKFRPRTGVEGLPTDDTMTTIKDSLQAILANQESALAVAERKAIAEERKADAFEFIAQHIGRLLGENFVSGNESRRAADQDETSVHTDMDDDSEKSFAEDAERILSSVRTESKQASTMDKDDILGIIASMRREGSTYNEIATHLDELNLPTFSGRGKWHAQTIHRLCQTV